VRSGLPIAFSSSELTTLQHRFLILDCDARLSRGVLKLEWLTIFKDRRQSQLQCESGYSRELQGFRYTSLVDVHSNRSSWVSFKVLALGLGWAAQAFITRRTRTDNQPLPRLNLTAANYVHIVEPQWNPAVEDQAIARAVRMGQTRPVTAFRYVVRNSVEEVSNPYSFWFRPHAHSATEHPQLAETEEQPRQIYSRQRPGR